MQNFVMTFFVLEVLAIFVIFFWGIRATRRSAVTEKLAEVAFIARREQISRERNLETARLQLALARKP